MPNLAKDFRGQVLIPGRAQDRFHQHRDDVFGVATFEPMPQLLDGFFDPRGWWIIAEAFAGMKARVRRKTPAIHSMKAMA